MTDHQGERASIDAGTRRVALLALDLDGTVLAPTGHATPRTRAAIRAALDAGIAVCIATGRSWWESRRVIAEAGLAGPGVFVGGAMVHEMAGGTCLAHDRMHGDVARDVCAAIDRGGAAAMVMQGPNDRNVEWLIAAEHPWPPTVPEWFATHASTYERVHGLASADHKHTVRISSVGPIEANARLGKSLLDAMGDRVYLHEIVVPTTGIGVIEVFDAAVNKWTGVRKVAAMLGVDARRVVAIGDDVNDLPMLEGAGLGVAMGNARDVVRRTAGLTIGSNAEDGLAAFLEGLAFTRGAWPAARVGAKGSDDG